MGTGMLFAGESSLADQALRYDQGLCDFRDALYFVFNFFYLKEVCWGDPEILGGEGFVDFRLRQTCESVLDYSLRLVGRDEMESSKYLKEHCAIIWDAFEEFRVSWKPTLAYLKNQSIDSLLYRSLSCRNESYEKFFELNFQNKGGGGVGMSEFVPGFLLFLKRERLSVPNYESWTSVYKKVSVHVSDWQLPLSVPDKLKIINEHDECINILEKQMYWALENGRIADLTRALGKLGAEQWLPFDSLAQ